MSGISVMKDFAMQLGYQYSFERLQEIGVSLDTCSSFQDVADELAKMNVMKNGYVSEQISNTYYSLQELLEDLTDNQTLLEEVVLGNVSFYKADIMQTDFSEDVIVIDDESREVYRFIEAIKKNQGALERNFGHR
ncbi:MAG TPA: hypothetical protein VM577_07855 [Anaerovoracaceae bacterium]|nr:hypothetical protein [Anaerovoracaceae bacterium]